MATSYVYVNWDHEEKILSIDAYLKVTDKDVGSNNYILEDPFPNASRTGVTFFIKKISILIMYDSRHFTISFSTVQGSYIIAYLFITMKICVFFYEKYIENVKRTS